LTLLAVLTLLEALISSTPIGIRKPTEDQRRKAWTLSCNESFGVSCKRNSVVAVSNTASTVIRDIQILVELSRTREIVQTVSGVQEMEVTSRGRAIL
jgi:hypothetical protein